MNLCIDQGNSCVKIAVFDNHELIYTASFEQFTSKEIAVLFERFTINNCILSSVIGNNNSVVQELSSMTVFFILLNHLTPIPIQNNYKTPETLGKDRLAAVVGANYIMPCSNLLVIDAGTAITFDFIDADQNYWGGTISPGISLRFRALHEFTQKLPLVEIPLVMPQVGDNTLTAIQLGVMQGVIYEIDGYIDILKNQHHQLSAFLTGGSTIFIETNLKNAIFAEPNLVLIGLNRILEYNVQK